MSDTIHLAKLSNLLKQAHREAVALAREDVGGASGWQREIGAIEYEVTMRMQSLLRGTRLTPEQMRRNRNRRF